MNQVLTVFKQIEPLISQLTDSERLELIQSIAKTRPTLATGMLQSESVDDESVDDLFTTQMLREQKAWYTLSVAERQHFHGEHVAVYQGNVIDHDADRLTLLPRIYKSMPIPILSSEQDSIPEYVVHRPQLIS